MTLRRTAFCRGLVKGFQRSLVKARGCGVGVYVGGTIGTDSKTLWSLEPSDGSLVWAAAPANTVRRLRVAPSGRVYAGHTATENIKEVNRFTGETDNTRTNFGGFVFDIFGDGDVLGWDYGDTDLVRTSPDMATDSLDEAIGQPFQVSIQGDGTPWATSVTTGEVTKLNADLTVDSTSSLGYNDTYQIITPAGDHFYMQYDETVAGPAVEWRWGKFKYSDKTEVAHYVYQIDGFSETAGFAAFDGTHLYFGNFRDTTNNRSIWKVAVSTMTLADDFDTGGNTISVALNGSSLICTGARSTTWTGSGGANASVWSLATSDMSVNWTYDTGAQTQAAATGWESFGSR
jgi:hypothetical protein